MFSDDEDISNRKELSENSKNNWRLNNILLNNIQVIDKITKKNFNAFELNENTIYQN